MKRRTACIILLLFGTLSSYAQVFPDKGMPLLRHFIPPQYQNKGKVWDIQSAPNGMVYMAADRGLLAFDGRTWESFRGSAGFIRSLLVTDDSTIYTGSDLDFGRWMRNAKNAWEYTSLYPFREDVQEVNEEFWDVHALDGSIVFVSSQSLYLYKNDQLTRVAAPTKFSGSHMLGDTLYLADDKQGLFALERLSLRQVFENPVDGSFEMSGMYRYEQGMVVVTRNTGLYLFASGKVARLENPLTRLLQGAIEFSFITIGDSYLAFGTVMKGLFITDLEGNIIHRVNRYKGLLSNTILSMYYSPSGKLWMGTEYGISSLFLRNEITYFYDYRGDYGTAYTAVLMDSVFYMGTNQGLYRSLWEDLSNDKEFTRFQLIPGTEGQVWTLKVIDSTLFIGHDHGLFINHNQGLEKMDDPQGVWTIVPYQDHLLTGTYNGIGIYERHGSEWVFLRKMELISGSCNQILVEQGNILWINIPNFGLVRASLDGQLNPMDRVIFPDSLFAGGELHLEQGPEGIRVIDGRVRYRYQSAGQGFVEDTAGLDIPAVDNLISGIYGPLPLHADYEFYPIYNGFALRYLACEKSPVPDRLTLLIKGVTAFNNAGSITVERGMRVPYKMNNIAIEYIVPNQDGISYQYLLSEEEEWSAWTTDPVLQIMGLASGDHRIVLRAGIDGRVLDERDFEFRIAAPWYASWYAYVFYFLILLLMIAIIWFWHKRSLARQQHRLRMEEEEALRMQAEQHREQVMRMEQERLQQENEQIKQQLRSKTLELARNARESEAKGRLLLSLKDKFESAQEDSFKFKAGMSEIRRLLDSFLKADDRTFEIQMDELHQEFFLRLKEKYPNLSNNDLRLSAYLKIGLNSKEIAELLNIQPSSAFISRSRLRKKLNLRSDEELFDFLNRI